MPFMIRYPEEIEPGTTNDDIVTNVDFAPLFLDYAGIDVPEYMQGRSFRPVLQGNTPGDWQDEMYYRYWMHGADHNVAAHYGIRTKRYKLIYYYADPLGQPGTIDEVRDPEWELFDLEKDPCELNSVYDDPEYASVVKDLKDRLHRLQADVGDERYDKDID
jgi:arylsulfatase A-like enzyme